jgi:hypothetical protein
MPEKIGFVSLHAFSAYLPDVWQQTPAKTNAEAKSNFLAVKLRAISMRHHLDMSADPAGNLRKPSHQNHAWRTREVRQLNLLCAIFPFGFQYPAEIEIAGNR